MQCISNKKSRAASKMKKISSQTDRRASSKAISTNAPKHGSGQKDILSMFRQQLCSCRPKSEPEMSTKEASVVMCPEQLSSMSSHKNDKLNKLSLKRKCISGSEKGRHDNVQTEMCTSVASAGWSTLVPSGMNTDDAVLTNGQSSPVTCITDGDAEVFLDTAFHVSNDRNYNGESYSKGNLDTQQHVPSVQNEQFNSEQNTTTLQHGSEGNVYNTLVTKEAENTSVEAAVVMDDSDMDDVSGHLLDDQDQRKDDSRIPYYLENFLLIIDTVMDDEYYRSLFNEQDRFHISIFQSLSEFCQMLYVRLIQRRHRWLTGHKIKYPKIAPDLLPILTDLVCAGLLLDASSMTDLEDVLMALPALDVKVLAKTLKLNIVSMQKADLVSAILRHSRRGGISTFFGGPRASNATSNMIMKRAKDLLGPCYKLESDIRSVFMRIIILFGLHRTRGEDDDAFGGQQQVFQMLMSSLGRIKYPEYTVSRKSKIFQDRASFLRFVSALQIESEMSESLENKNYEEADLLFKKAASDRQQLLEESDSLEYDKQLPDYLRPYTAGAVHIRIMSLCVELLQYRRQYREAVDLLEELINQDVYHTEYRGRWYDRLALNLDHHLKQHSKALDKIILALNDPLVRTGHRLSLYQRADKICHMTCNKKSLLEKWTEFESDKYSSITEAPKVYIQGKRLACGQQGPLYISKDGDDVTLLTRVEDVALAHYKAQGYTEGIHGEGSTFMFLFGLLFWDIIFMDGIPDTFYNLYQTCPLDWGSDHFYSSRQHAIDKRLADMCRASTRKLERMLEKSWEEHENTLCMGVNWDRFTDITQAKGFIKCLGGSALSGILQRIAKNMRYVGGGMPDLVVWNPDSKILKMVEVKGPGDRLSTKQILWLDYLVSLGISAEVCHVQAISSKKLNS